METSGFRTPRDVSFVTRLASKSSTGLEVHRPAAIDLRATSRYCRAHLKRQLRNNIARSRLVLYMAQPAKGMIVPLGLYVARNSLILMWSPIHDAISCKNIDESGRFVSQRI
jgi:hypothetical protein